jgi:hypothetical protein
MNKAVFANQLPTEPTSNVEIKHAENQYPRHFTNKCRGLAVGSQSRQRGCTWNTATTILLTQQYFAVLKQAPASNKHFRVTSAH